MLLKSVGLEEGKLSYVPDMAQNAVLKQMVNGAVIEPGQPILKGSKVDLVLGEGLGTAQFDAPMVIDMPLDEAKIAIIGAGLKVGQQMEVPASDGQAAGIVVRQNPESGNKVRVGDVIDLWVTPQGVEPNPTNEKQPEQ